MQELYKQYKNLLFTLAYQLTGSASDAEDAVQDVFVKAYDVNLDLVAEPKAYLCKMVTNRCLDVMKSARRRREQYFGEWLPEPILTPEDDSLETVIRGELLSYAMLVLLERLSPAERAVFVLREALGFDYPVIAELIGKSEVNCRKLISRAKGKMGIGLEEPIRAESGGEEWVRRFVSALQEGQVDTVVSLLAEDAALISDGGGKATAAINRIESRDHVTRFLIGLIRKYPQYSEDVQLEDINGQTGVVIRSEGRIETILLFNFEDDVIRNLYFIRNPDKLTI